MELKEKIKRFVEEFGDVIKEVEVKEDDGWLGVEVVVNIRRNWVLREILSGEVFSLGEINIKEVEEWLEKQEEKKWFVIRRDDLLEWWRCKIWKYLSNKLKGEDVNYYVVVYGENEVKR